MAIRAPLGVLSFAVFLIPGGASWAAEPGFHHDIEPILFAHCAPCHHAGGSAPFPLLTYDDARQHARAIADVTRRRYMPPWLPEAGYGEFEDDRRLADAQIRSIQEWVTAGAPEGLRVGAPKPPQFTSEWQLGTPDLVITASKAFAVPADGPDLFWNFVLAPGVGETRYVQAIEIRPGLSGAVHHANLLIDRAGSARGDGFPGMDVTLASETFDPDSHFLFWKPGGTPWKEPAGMAWRLDPGNALILNMHLRPIGRPAEVQPSVALYFTKEAPSKLPMLVQLEHDGALDIPAGARDFTVTDELRLPVDVDLLAVYPHAHYLGKVLEGYATLPDGERRAIIRIPDWDLNWQAVYRLKSPMFLPKGTVVAMRFQYDNSAANPRNPHSPPARVVVGNQAQDEMAHLWLQVLPRGEGDQRPLLQEVVMKRRLEKYPGDFVANFNLGALCLSRKDVAAALAYLNAAVKAEPEQPAALNTFGVALEAAGQHDEAEEQFRHVLRIRPGDSPARYNLAGTLAAQGRLEEAAGEYRQLGGDRAAKEHLAQLLREIGDRAAADGKTREASDSYRELVTLVPRDADARNNFGILLARSGDIAGAIVQFEAALAIDPAHASARKNLEVARRKQR